jgi:hypothetical protein
MGVFLKSCNCYKNLAGFPAGLRFNPSDQELIEHLESMVLAKEGGGSRAHALINHFIPTIEEDIGICYTHPENLPGEIKISLEIYILYICIHAHHLIMYIYAVTVKYQLLVFKYI